MLIARLTTRTTPRTNARWTAAAAALALIAGTAAAQTTDDASNDAPGGDQNASLLAGPEVVESTGPGAGSPLDGSRAQGWRRGEPTIRMYGRAIRALHKEGRADDALALRPEQGQEIRAAIKGYADAMKGFLREHRDEVAEIRELTGGRLFDRITGETPDRRGERRGAMRNGPRGERGPMAGARGGPMMDDAPPRSREDMRAAGERLRELMKEAPSDHDAKKRIWAALNEDQRAFVENELEQVQAQRRARMDRAMEGDRTPGQRTGQPRRRGAPVDRGDD